jgi:hypothetical protein
MPHRDFELPHHGLVNVTASPGPHPSRPIRPRPSVLTKWQRGTSVDV